MKIITISDFPGFRTGYGRVIRMINRGLIDAGHTVIGVAQGLQTTVCVYDDYSVYDYRELQTLINIFNPDIVFLLGDLYRYQNIQMINKNFRLVGYIPVDGEYIPYNYRNLINKMDKAIAFTEFGKNEILKYTQPQEIVVVPHGVDLNAFTILPHKNVLKKAHNLPEDSFVVGFVGRNQQRKNIPALMEAFKKFSEGKDNTYLYLHTPTVEVGWNILELSVYYELKGKVLTTAGYTPNTGLDDEGMNIIYNLFDVFVLPSMGEGFGLPILEAQACGVYTLATDWSACRDLLPPEQRIRIGAKFTIPHWNVVHALIDVDDLAEKIDKAYRNFDLYNKPTEYRERVSEYSWEKIIPKLIYEITAFSKPMEEPYPYYAEV